MPTNHDFALCEILHNLSSVWEDFPCDEFKEKINKTLTLIQNKHLNVAVIGEFRRGKSSLINALLGMPVLPVDIEPTTASINRVTYGLKPTAIIHYKDGNSSEIPITELSNYVTKLTPEAAQIAENVKEAEIRYPTELCSNHIDIIDTPGLNDSENMTIVTESLLDNIQVAVVAIKSTMPYSETECQWVTRLLSLPKLQHIVFVLTCMDLVRERDVPKVLSFAKERIPEKTLESVRTHYGDKPEIISKAEKLFDERNFALYPVSALSALDSFENGDYELLQKSNISALKKGLLTTINVQQQMVCVYEMQDLIEDFAKWFSTVSVEDYTKNLTRQLRLISEYDVDVKAYFAKRSKTIENTMQNIDREIGDIITKFLSTENVENIIRKHFIKHLSNVSVNTDEVIAAALHRAESDVLTNILPIITDNVRKLTVATIARNLNEFLADRDKTLHYAENRQMIEESGMPSSEALRASVVYRLREFKLDMPQIALSVPKTLVNHNVIDTVINPYIDKLSAQYRKAWQNTLPEYTQKWYSVVLRQETPEMCNRLRNVIYTHKGAIEEKISFSQTLYEKTCQTIKEEKNKFCKLKEEISNEAMPTM